MARFWMNLQIAVDLSEAEKKLAGEVEAIHCLLTAPSDCHCELERSKAEAPRSRQSASTDRDRSLSVALLNQLLGETARAIFLSSDEKRA